MTTAEDRIERQKRDSDPHLYFDFGYPHHYHYPYHHYHDPYHHHHHEKDQTELEAE